MNFDNEKFSPLFDKIPSSRLLLLDFGKFGDESYSREELVAELSSAFAGKQLGMNPLPRKENAQYLKGWLIWPTV